MLRGDKPRLSDSVFSGNGYVAFEQGSLYEVGVVAERWVGARQRCPQVPSTSNQIRHHWHEGDCQYGTEMTCDDVFLTASVVRCAALRRPRFAWS